MNTLRPSWKFISYNWKFGLFLILLFGIPRFIMVLNANMSGGYGTVSILFLVMWVTPFIFLSKTGRKEIGIRKPKNYMWLLYSFLIGFAVCTIMFISAKLMYGDTVNNSFFYISRSYTIPPEALAENKLMFFLMFSVTGMTFSPIGEELFYRGVVHGSFVGQLGERKASIIDSLAFAITHLAHFGIVYNAGVWSFLPIPAALWMLGMFILCRLLFVCKQKSGSILGAILGHAGYNIAMIYFIFYHIF